MLARDFVVLCIGAGPCWTPARLCLDGRCKYMWRVLVLGAGNGVSLVLIFLPKALFSFVVALAFAGL